MSSTPTQILKMLLAGDSPPRPLWLPIVFATGASLENLPLGVFLANPTKISNSARQLRNHLQSDGIAGYFDPYLEAEAMGAVIDWGDEERPACVAWPSTALRGDLPPNLRSPEEALKAGRIRIAIDVIRRLKALVRDGSLLTAGVSGPLTLAARITQLEGVGSLTGNQPFEAAVEIATSTLTLLCAALVEEGTNVIFVREEVFPKLSAETGERWSELLVPLFNIIRFYQALPILQIPRSGAFAENLDLFLNRRWDCVVCPQLVELESLIEQLESSPLMLGAALPQAPSVPARESFDLVLSRLHPVIVSTICDVTSTSEIGGLIEIGRRVRDGLRS